MDDMDAIIKFVQAKIANRIFQDVYGDPREKTPEGKVHVSDIVSDCHRKNYYYRTSPIFFFDMETTMNFWHGRIIHSRPILSEQELEVEWNNIIGHVDDYGDEILIEKKTTSSIPSSPYAYHVRQAEYYRVLLEKTNHPVKAVFIVYYLKSMEPVFPAVMPINCRPVEVVANEMIQKRDIVLESIKNKILPPPNYGAECRYCSYISLCFGDKLGVVPI